MNNSNSRSFLRQKELLSNHVPISASTLWRLVRTGEFPAPIKLSKAITAWRKAEVLDWLDERGKKCPP